MKQDSLTATEIEVKKAVTDILEYAGNYNVEILDRLYADTMRVINITTAGKVVVVYKTEILNFFRSMRNLGTEPTNTTVEFKRIEVDDDLANVVVTCFGKVEKSVYTLSLAKTEIGWQVLEETAVAIG